MGKVRVDPVRLTRAQKAAAEQDVNEQFDAPRPDDAEVARVRARIEEMKAARLQALKLKAQSAIVDLTLSLSRRPNRCQEL